MAAQKIAKCTFAQKKACLFEGSGCDSVAQRSCEESKRILACFESPCPALLSGKCDIPKYRALLPSGKPCGSEEGCNIPRWFIPAHDYENGIIQPKNKPSPSAWEVKELLRTC